MVVWLGIGFSTTEKPAHASAVHDHIIVAAPHLADGAGVHAPVCAGYKRDLESLCMLADGMPYEKVAKYSKLTLEEVKALDAKKPA